MGSAPIKSIDGKVHITPEKSVSVGKFSFPTGIETDWIAFGPFYGQISPPFQHKFTNHKFILAKDVGIIKRCMQNDSLHFVWELVDYKIVK